MTGRTLGHYEILDKLGEGGMGAVYRARDTMLERTVAVKVLGERWQSDATARARLLREARTASALNHPNICTIYEVGEAEGQTFIAMELVEGRPLSQLIPVEGLPLETVFRYGSQMADALAHAHERSVVHRDLKSSNVMVTPQGRAKVLDFGLAKRVVEAEGGATRSQGSLTDAGSVVGTLAYMAPEVLQGEPADARSDLWALGVMLYEMTAGRLPFQGTTSFAVSSAILRESPPPLSTAPPGLRSVVERCLAKEPGQRYQRAGEALAALEAIQSGAVPAAAAARGRLIPRRVWIGVVTTGAAAALAGVALKLRTKGRPPAKSKIPEANEYFDRAMLFLKTQYDLARARQMLERALEIDPRFAEARAWYGFTHVLMIDSGYSNDPTWLYKAEQEIQRALQDDPSLARAHSALAATRIYQGRKELARTEAEKALQLDPNDLDGHVWLAQCHVLNGDYAPAQALLKRLMDRDPLLIPARMMFGDNLRLQGDPAGSIREQEKILEQDPQNIYSLLFLAMAHLTAGDAAKGRQSLERMRPSDRQNYQVRAVWALQLALEGKRDEALKEMDAEVLKYAELAYLIMNPAEVYAPLGDAVKALEWLERVVRAGDERAEWFRRDPFLASLRDHPRFRQILESIALRQQQRTKAAQ